MLHLLRVLLVAFIKHLVEFAEFVHDRFVLGSKLLVLIGELVNLGVELGVGLVFSLFDFFVVSQSFDCLIGFTIGDYKFFHAFLSPLLQLCVFFD